MTLTARPAKPQDAPFVGDSWGRSFYNWNQGQYDNHKRSRDEILMRCRLLVLCFESTPDQILGWIAFEAPNVLHYVYVKQPFRRRGLATFLLNAADLSYPIKATHKTYAWEFLKHKGKRDVA